MDNEIQTLQETIKALEEKLYVLENLKIKELEERLSVLEYCVDTRAYYE